MKSQSNTALKEWAVVVKALREGRQCLLFRKGGIADEGGVFKVEHNEFFLFPTFEHQTITLLKPEFQDWLVDVEREHNDPSKVVMDCYAVADEVVVANEKEKLMALDGQHIWNEAYVEQRLRYKPQMPLYVLLLRVYRLPQAHIIENLPEYDGCRSWVTLKEKLSTEGAVPVLSDEAFAKLKEMVQNALLSSCSQ